jgi:hypothetical protein
MGLVHPIGLAAHLGDGGQVLEFLLMIIITEKHLPRKQQAD